MILLNLLPPTKKKDLRLIQLYTVIKNLIIIVLIFTIVATTILLIIKIVLQNYFNEIVAQTTLTTKTLSVFNKDIKTFNKNLSIVEDIQKNFIPWTNFLVNFTRLVPDNVSIYNLNINKVDDTTYKIFIYGFAKNRDGLLAFKNNLENSNDLKEISVPLENLLTKEDIKFNIKATINLNQPNE